MTMYQFGRSGSKNMYWPRLAAGMALATSLLAQGAGAQTPAAQSAGQGVPPQLGSEATSLLQDEPVILSAPKTDSKRVYVTDPGHFYVTSKIFTIDGAKGKLLAMTDAGKLPHIMASKNGEFFAVANTLFARIARGERNDYVELVDAQTHDIITEIDIPEGRFLTASLERLASMSVDDKFLLFQQFAPSPAVGLVDLEKKSFVKMMDVPDCYYIFPAPDNKFYMHCRDGSLLKMTYDAQGNAKQETTRVFHPETDYMLNNPAYSNKSGRLVWPSYEGRIYQANLGAEAEFLEPFEAFSEEERADRWRPGGWMTVAYHGPSDSIYLLADQREKWTHKLPSRFVFVYEASTGKRLHKIELGHEIDSIGVSQDSEPLLYALSAGEQTMFIYEPDTGKQIGMVDELGHAPVMLTIPEL